MRNIYKYYLIGTIWTAVTTFTSGTVLQTFLMENGYSESLTNIFSSVYQIASMVIALLFSATADRIRNVIRAYAGSHLLYLPLLFVLVAICYTGSISPLLTMLLWTAMIIYSSASGINSSLCYKVPYIIMDMSHYGRVTSIVGILIGVFGLLMSAMLTWLQNSLGYTVAVRCVFWGCIPCILIVYILCISLKPLSNTPVPSPKNAEKLHYFRFKPFSQLIFPNLARGLGSGILNVAVTIGYFCGYIDNASAAIMVIISQLTTLVGGGIYFIVTGRVPERLILLLSCIGLFLTVPFMVVGSNTLVFLIFYGAVNLFGTIVNNSVPVAVIQIADYSIIGQYSSGRLLVHAVGSSLSGILCIPLIRLIGVFPTMLLTGCMFLVCGFSYYGYMKKNGLR